MLYAHPLNTSALAVQLVNSATLFTFSPKFLFLFHINLCRPTCQQCQSLHFFSRFLFFIHIHHLKTCRLSCQECHSLRSINTLQVTHTHRYIQIRKGRPHPPFYSHPLDLRHFSLTCAAWLARKSSFQTVQLLIHFVLP